MITDVTSYQRCYAFTARRLPTAATTNLLSPYPKGGAVLPLQPLAINLNEKLPRGEV